MIKIIKLNHFVFHETTRSEIFEKGMIFLGLEIQYQLWGTLSPGGKKCWECFAHRKKYCMYIPCGIHSLVPYTPGTT